MAIVWILLVELLCIQLISSVCPSKKTGPGCVYTCHCSNPGDCNEYSNCQGQCRHGDRWRGRTCQEENVAREKATNSSQTEHKQRSEKAVNGQHNGYNVEFLTLATLAWWSVDLGSRISVQEVVIYFRNSTKIRRNGIIFKTSTFLPNSSDNSTWGTTCYTVKGRDDGTDINDTLSIPQCGGTWRHLFIYTDTKTQGDKDGPAMDFTEVEVYACSNGTYGAACSQFCDGCNSDGCDNSGQCRTDCAKGRYGNNCEKYCNNRHCVLPSQQCDRYTWACLSGGCEAGYKGSDCSQRCPVGKYGIGCLTCSSRHCSGDQICPLYGICSQGCQSGWTLETCTKACPSGFYGMECNSSCGQCNNNETCDHETGNCPHGCMPGRMPGLCQKTCTSGVYGDNCKQTCGHCNGTCSLVTGKCPRGCANGYTGDKCTVMSQTENKSTSDYIPVVVGVIAVIVLIAVVVILIIVFRRQRSAGQREIPTDRSSRPLHISDGNMVVNVANVASETPNTKDKSSIREAAAMPETHTLSTSKPQSEALSDPDLEEEIFDEEEPISNRHYYNIDDVVVIREIPIGELATTIQKIKSLEGEFETEYSRLPNGFTAQYGDSQKPENTGKNRYRGYYPYDYNRVHLSLLPDIPGSDYINASLMHSYNQAKTYIAAQAPTKNTVGDFWRMIWEHGCERVIMLTGLVEDMRPKCYQYWPDEDKLETDHYKIQAVNTNTRANYTVRHLKVQSNYNGECRSVVQYHFTSWPDHGVPDTLALVDFIWMIRQTDPHTYGPLIVHCSAGIGRTGTYIAIDSLLDQAREEGVVDVLGFVSVMRGQRKNMIQAKEQYECVFHCLMEMTKVGNTCMNVENFTVSLRSRGMDSMVDRKTLRELTQMMIAENHNKNTVRNRLWVDGNENFMVRLGPTLRHARGYLMAVVPPPALEKLLWKLVEENNVHNVIVISQLQDDLIGGKCSRRNCGAVTLTTTGVFSLDSDLTMMTLELQRANSEDFRNVKLFKFERSPNLDSISSCLLNHAHLHHLSGEITPNVIIHSELDRKCAVALSIMGNILRGIIEDHRVDVIGHARMFLKYCPDLTFTEQEMEKFIHFARKFIQMTTVNTTYANV